MQQGSGIFDTKDGHDFLYGDWSERTEPLGPWCNIHGYHGECPGCTVVVVVDGVPTVLAPEVFPLLVEPELEPAYEWTPEPQWFVPDEASGPLAADPSLWEQVKQILAPSENEAAAAKGRAVHERALVLVEATGCAYDEAIARALGEGP